jgi:hypothetical protein
MKFLISVSNYCDPEYEMTIKSLWENAEMKDKLFFSLVSEDFVEYDFSFIPKNQISYKHFQLNENDPIYRGGVCWSRNLALQVDFDYDYYIQFDSHTIATPSWDIKSLSAYKSIEQDYDKVIISGHPADYEYEKDGSINFHKFPITPTYVKTLNNLVPGLTFPRYHTVPLGESKKSAWVTGCYIFAPKKWVDEVGIEESWPFNVEEFMMTLLSFNFGWSVVSYGQRHVFHHSSHKQPDGTITRNQFRPWADSRADQYWNHVYGGAIKLNKILASVPYDDKYPFWMINDFFEIYEIDKKYMNYIPNYPEHDYVPHTHFGMPPRNKN